MRYLQPLSRRSPASAVITQTVFTHALDSVFLEILAACGCALTD